MTKANEVAVLRKAIEQRMNLYLIKTLDGFNYDEYDSAVVAAPSAKSAKKIHPSGDNARFGTKYDGWPTDLEKIGVTYIGIAARDTEAGVILGSFNAG